MARLACVIVVAVLVIGSEAQFGGIPGMEFMNQMMNNIGRMTSGMHAEGMRRAHAGRRFGPGETRFRTAGGGSGFVYNSPDGSSSSYSFGTGGPSRGFSYSYGPGGEYRREW